MKQYLDRMKTELSELNAKIKKSEEIVNSKPYGMDETSKNLLAQQIDAMKHYAVILQYRIDYEGRK